MPKRSNNFQRLIFMLESAMAKRGFVLEESGELTDRITGAQREVDILITGIRASDKRRVAVAVECRDHARRQDVTWIEQLIGKYSDLDANQCIAVSRKGFTEPAIRKAEAYGIEVLSAVNPSELDWDSVLARSSKFTVGYTTEIIEQVILQQQPHDPDQPNNTGQLYLVQKKDLALNVSGWGESCRLGTLLGKKFPTNSLLRYCTSVKSSEAFRLGAKQEWRKAAVINLDCICCVGEPTPVQFGALIYTFVIKQWGTSAELRKFGYRDMCAAHGQSGGDKFLLVEDSTQQLQIVGLVEGAIRRAEKLTGIPITAFKKTIEAQVANVDP